MIGSTPMKILGGFLFAGIMFLCLDIAYQYLTKFSTPLFARDWDKKIAPNINWIDSIGSYSIEYRSNIKNPKGKLILAYSLIKPCRYVTGINFSLDSNQKILQASVSHQKTRPGDPMVYNLPECDSLVINAYDLEIWSSRILYLNDTLGVSEISLNNRSGYFRFGTDLIGRKNQSLGYDCHKGLTYNEVAIDSTWMLHRNCVVF